MDQQAQTRRFVALVNEAHGVANDDQRRLIRMLAAMNLSLEENITHLEKVMGW